MEAKELEMMSKILHDNMKRSLENELKVNIMNRTLEQESVPDECFEALEQVNKICFICQANISRYLDQKISLEECMDNTINLMNKIIQGREENE